MMGGRKREQHDERQPVKLGSRCKRDGNSVSMFKLANGNAIGAGGDLLALGEDQRQDLLDERNLKSLTGAVGVA